MKYLVLSITLIHFVNLVLCTVTVQPRENLTMYDLHKTIAVTCKVSITEGEKVSVTWLKNVTNVSEDTSIKGRFKTSELNGNYTLEIHKATDQEYANYTCVVNNVSTNTELGRATILAAGRAKVKTPTNVNVVEGEKLRIPCTVYGRPAPVIYWEIGNKSYTESEGAVRLLPDKDKNISNAILAIDNLNITDRGIYKCIGRSEIDGQESSHDTMVRIKDKYAALWPFLGICLEVFVLCAIILIYEKKRNKTELEESDTDQSPDQKNTPDHGKETNLRHRQ